MSNANFNVLYNGIEREWRTAEKMSALTNAFTNTNNYFTTSQAGRLIQLVSNENDRLQLAKASYRSITDPANFIQINELLPSQASRDALTAYVTWYTGNNSTVNNTNTGIYKTPMATATFNKLIQDVKNEWMPGAKMNLLTSAFANTNNYFSTNQAGQLIQLVSDEDNRLQLAKSSYRNITDPANFTQLYQLFSYQANRDALAAYVNSYNGTVGSGTTIQYKTPMSDANFNQIMNDVKAQWLPFGKMNALTTTFANPDYYFTASQTKQLIQLVSDEDNRLQLAKSAYRNMTDRANITQLYDLFNSQSLRDALASYVSSYRDSAGY
jgi:DNA polymerase IIIc chi subunit